MLSVRRLSTGSHVELHLHEPATDLGRAHSWTVKIARDRVCYSCHVGVRYDDVVVQASGNGFDGAVAGREAFQKIEGLLRERRARDVERAMEVTRGVC